MSAQSVTYNGLNVPPTTTWIIDFDSVHVEADPIGPKRVRAVCEQLRRDRVRDYWKRPSLWDAICVSTVEHIGKWLFPYVNALVALESW